ncbi:hypothetical protein IGL07_002171 [Enterococcus sp. DIV1368f]|uniref:hypothetical protein n=1 Tax=Enterococcus TaxID=1350 RepID=UPI00032F7812|nr:hypothetical protein [Enterococcus faecalis]EJI7260521.1 hypothetical protein [Enterococcus faecalis]EOJ53960.1 hypothetical protein WMI_02130 [Enterococcus faecalis EnGen0363]NSM74170.1 hypothetical protein [Enterococcus faecalis]HBC4453070.1 hypothetical protein [Enterococcus faecalis]HBC4454680.1 hypothetical protein [Enterococcus faecalis]
MEEKIDEVEVIENIEHKNTFADILTFYDLQKLPSDILKEVAENLGYEPSNHKKVALSELIWEQISSDKATKQNAFSDFELSLFSNKVTFTWYKAVTLKGLMDLIVKDKGAVVLDGIFNIDEETITTVPQLIAIAPCPSEMFGSNCFLARYLYQDGFYYVPTASGNQRFKKIKSLTAFVDEENGIIEVRAKGKLIKRVVENLVSFFGDRPDAYEYSILANHEDNTENLAKALDGYLIESVGEPTLSLENLSDEQLEAIKSVLNVIDEGLSKEDVEPDYSLTIDAAREVLFDTQDPVPFLALVLAGLDKVSLSTLYQSLISSPLYSSLSPYLTNQGGYVKFHSSFNGIKTENTIQVARRSNSVYLPGNSNEITIKKIRDTIFQQKNKTVNATEVDKLVEVSVAE